MALPYEPDILLADGPTAALDVTIQAPILTVIDSLQRDLGTVVMLITNDLGVVAGPGDRVVVVFAGRVEAPLRSPDPIEGGRRELRRRPACQHAS